MADIKLVSYLLEVHCITHCYLFNPALQETLAEGCKLIDQTEQSYTDIKVCDVCL
jgi:hypothetical protein